MPDAAKAAYTIAQQTTYPSYGRWATELGWTSLGEYWEQSSRTRNHHMFGSIGQWFYEGLAGIEAGQGRLRADRVQAADRRGREARQRVGVV